MGKALHVALHVSRHERHVGAGLRRVAGVDDAVLDFGRQDARAGDAVGRQMRSELPGDDDLVQLVHADAGLVQQRHEPRQDGALGELDLSDVALRDDQALGMFGQDEHALAVLVLDQARAAPIALVQLLQLDEGAVLAHEAAAQKLAHDGEDAATAEARRLRVADDLEFVSGFGNRDLLDGAFGGAHAGADVHALEGGARRARAGLERAMRCEHDLAVRADVDEQHVARLILELAHVRAGHNVGSDVGGNLRERVQARTWRHVDPDARRGEVLGACEGGGEGGFADAAGIHPEQHVHHRAVRADRQLVDGRARDARFGANLADHAVDGLDHDLLQVGHAVVGMLELVGDAREHVEPEDLLRVDLRGVCHALARRQVHQLANHGGRADVDGDAVQRAGRVAGLEPNNLAAMEHGRPFAGIQARLCKDVGIDCLDAQLRAELILERRLVFERGTPHGHFLLPSLGRELEIRHDAGRQDLVLALLVHKLDGHVLGRLDEARKAHPLAQVALRQQALLGVRDGRLLAADDLHAALPAGALAIARVVHEYVVFQKNLEQRLSGSVFERAPDWHNPYGRHDGPSFQLASW